MAVQNKYVDTNLNAGKIGHGSYIKGGAVICLPFTFELLAADDDGSVYRIAKALNPDLILVKAEIFCDTVTSGTDWDLGLYEPLVDGAGGTVVDKDIFADGMDFSTAKPLSAAGLFGLKDVNIDSVQKKLYEIAGHTISTRKAAYDIALTANTVGSAAVTVSGYLWFIQG